MRSLWTQESMWRTERGKGGAGQSWREQKDPVLPLTAQMHLKGDPLLSQQDPDGLCGQTGLLNTGKIGGGALAPTAPDAAPMGPLDTSVSVTEPNHNVEPN